MNTIMPTSTYSSFRMDNGRKGFELLAWFKIVNRGIRLKMSKTFYWASVESSHIDRDNILTFTSLIK